MKASLHRWCMVNTGSVLIAMLSIVLFIPSGATGQDKKSGGGGESPAFQKKLKTVQEYHDQQKRQQSSPTLDPVMSGVDLNSLNGDYTIYEHDQMWNRNPNPNPEWDFRLYEQGEPAGDINGDGINDFVVTDFQAEKTAVFFGDNTSGDPDQIIERQLKPVGDLNGDGYADAIAVDTPKIVEIYEGSIRGYRETGATVNGLNPGSYEILGFIDFNQDRREDIFAYSQNSGEIQIAEGAVNSDSITAETHFEVLSYSPKKVVVKDIDQDSLVEIIEFSGSNGDGGIRISKIGDPESTPQFITLGHYFENASFADLHLIDVNGNEYDDIYISLGSDNPKYIMEYDTLNGSYQSAKQIMDGELVPAGDLNNDGKHDFIMGDSTDSNAPYIAYGSEDLSSSISLDVPLEGDIGSNWSWEMAYNPYSGFGDLNGDGIDDVLLAHTETSGGNTEIGRRLLLGNASKFHTSEFHLYSYENFHNRIFEVEELGDINFDGIDDFAMVLADQGKVEIYHGGEIESPAHTINSGVSIGGITSDEFTGDGFYDLIVLSNTWEGPVIEVYELQSSITKVKTISISDFQNAELNAALGLHAIGDINGNGSSDFVVGSGIAQDTSGYLNEAYIFYGGSTISSQPDEIKPMDPSGDFFSRAIYAGASAAALGDMNGDGKNDFALGSPNKPNGDRLGEVQLFLSGSESPVSLVPQGFPFLYGWDIVSGDFNGDYYRDIAVSVGNPYTNPPAIVHIYNGGTDFDNQVDQTLSLPDPSSEGDYIQQIHGELEVVQRSGKDELIIGSESNSNPAALFIFNDSGDAEVSYFRKANNSAGLGSNVFYGVGEVATGDFNGNGKTDAVMSQYNDNSDSYQSSRVYRYELPSPIYITSIEDVPEDQGATVHVKINGTLLDAVDNGFSSFDSLKVERRSPEGEWTTVKSTTENIREIDVAVPETQPTDAHQGVDHSYSFMIEILDEQRRVIARSNSATGRALDNIPPPQVQNVSFEEQEGSKVLSWQEVDAPDVGTYLIFTTDADGQYSEIPMDSTDENSFTLPDHFEGVQTFAVAAWDVNNNEGVVSTPVNAIYPQTAEYATEEGWNLIGLPVEANTDSIQSLLQDPDLTIYEYDGGYKQVTELEPAKGYWAKFTDVETRTLEGLPFTEFTVDLKEGWNLISGVGGETPVESVEDPDEIIIAGTAYTFDQAYLASDTLRPASGYWIRTDAAGTVTFTHPKLYQNQREANEKTKNYLAKTSEEIIKEFNKVVISDGSNSTELFFGGQLPHEVNRLRYSLPPLPPGEFFDARYEGDSRLVEKHEVNIQLNKIEENPLSLKINAGDMAEQNEFVIKEFADGELRAEYKVNASEEISIKHKDTDSIYLAPDGLAQMSQEMPDKFNLDQNYPNPFNPTTQIQYSVPEATEVKLEIFNILGRRVRTLINERKEPGNYEVTFNGSNLASGLYLYRLQAGDFISTKKFILAK